MIRRPTSEELATLAWLAVMLIVGAIAGWLVMATLDCLRLID